MITLTIASIKSNNEKVFYSKNINVNSSSYVNYDKEYVKSSLSFEDKKKIALKKNNLSESMYQVLAGIVASESKANSYNESYAVASVIFNRTHSKRWISSINNKFGNGKGTNMYYQAISPGQFTVYSSGSYKKYINNVPKAVNEALVELLYEQEPSHNYLSFRCSNYKGANTVQFENGGNKYFGELTDAI